MRKRVTRRRCSRSLRVYGGVLFLTRSSLEHFRFRESLPYPCLLARDEADGCFARGAAISRFEHGLWKLDRAGRSLPHLIEFLKGLQGRGIEFVSITEQIDTTTPGSKLIFHLMGALAEFERDLIRERTNAGLAAAKARGRVGGRPRKLKTNGKVALARQMFADQSHSLPEICAALGISRATLYRYVKEAKQPE